MKKLFLPTVLLSWLASAAAWASPAYEGMAKPWQLGFQDPASPVMEKLVNMHDYLLVTITIITLLVLAAIVFI
jgi:cytochrome c oxidase subunit 2